MRHKLYEVAAAAYQLQPHPAVGMLETYARLIQAGSRVLEAWDAGGGCSTATNQNLAAALEALRLSMEA